MKKVILIVALFSSFLFCDEYSDWVKSQNSSFDKYQENFEKDFKEYKKAYNESFDEYTTSIGKIWSKKEVSGKHKWVEYSPDFKAKKVINYEKEYISIDVIAKNEREAKKKIVKEFDKISGYTVKKAYTNDILEKKIAKKLKKDRKDIKSNEKLVLFNQKQKNRAKKNIVLKKKKYKGNFIYNVKIKLPPKSILNKAKSYKSDVVKQSKKVNIPMELIYAIMHSESSFNPMARSHVPAYGLMQIVPRSAGIDTYKFLYGKKKMLSSSYLYNYKNNILIGSNYLHIIYYRYMKKIKNPQSRLYCTIAAYNTGAGNVSKTFIGNYNIYKASAVINKMTSQEVYNKLIRDLPYSETKHYLKKVNKRISLYSELINKGKI